MSYAGAFVLAMGAGALEATGAPHTYSVVSAVSHWLLLKPHRVCYEGAY